MFHQRSILIVEDEPLIALDLAAQVVARAGRVIGPLPTVAEALTVLESEEIAAAILDANLADRDVTPVALLLARKGVPFVLHSAIGIPNVLKEQLPLLTLVPKPADPSIVIARLLAVMEGR